MPSEEGNQQGPSSPGRRRESTLLSTEPEVTLAAIHAAHSAESDILRNELHAGAAELAAANAKGDDLRRSLAQSQADVHAALEGTDVLRRQLGAAASERAYYPCPCLRLVCWVCVLCQLTFTKKMKRQPCVVVAVLCVLRCLCFNFLYE